MNWFQSELTECAINNVMLKGFNQGSPELIKVLRRFPSHNRKQRIILRIPISDGANVYVLAAIEYLSFEQELKKTRLRIHRRSQQVVVTSDKQRMLGRERFICTKQYEFLLIGEFNLSFTA